MIGAQNCVSSCNGPCPCPYCVCPKHQLSDIGVVFPQRSRARTTLLTHTVVGTTCPACNMDIVEEVTDKQRQVTVHVRGQTYPPVPRHLQESGVTHLQLHEGIVPGQTVNYHLEPNDWAVCLLHVNLCIVGGLLQKTLLNEKDKLVDTMATESHGKQLYDLLKHNGVYFKFSALKNKRSKKMQLHDLTFKQTSFTGRAGEIVFRLRNMVTRVHCSTNPNHIYTHFHTHPATHHTPNVLSTHPSPPSQEHIHLTQRSRPVQSQRSPESSN